MLPSKYKNPSRALGTRCQNIRGRAGLCRPPWSHRATRPGPGPGFAGTREAELLWTPSFAVTFPGAEDADGSSCRMPCRDPPEGQRAAAAFSTPSVKSCS